jgi:hypothetical protein
MREGGRGEVGGGAIPSTHPIHPSPLTHTLSYCLPLNISLSYSLVHTSLFPSFPFFSFLFFSGPRLEAAGCPPRAGLGAGAAGSEAAGASLEAGQAGGAGGQGEGEGGDEEEVREGRWEVGSRAEKGARREGGGKRGVERKVNQQPPIPFASKYSPSSISLTLPPSHAHLCTNRPHPSTRTATPLSIASVQGGGACTHRAGGAAADQQDEAANAQECQGANSVAASRGEERCGRRRGEKRRKT